MLLIQCGHFYYVRHQIYKEYDTKQFEPLHELKYTSPYHSNNWPVVLSLTFSHNSEGEKGFGY